MNKHIREVMLEQQHEIAPSDLMGIKIDSPYFDGGRIVGYCKQCQLVKMEFREGAMTVTESLYEVLGPDYSLGISDKALERRFGHLREFKNAAQPSAPVTAAAAKHARRAVMEAKLRSRSQPMAKTKPGSASESKPKVKRRLKATPHLSSKPSSQEKPGITAARSRVQEMARLGPPPNAQPLFGKKAVRGT